MGKTLENVLENWFWMALAVVITLLFFVPSMLLWRIRRQDLRAKIRFFLSEPLNTGARVPVGPVQIEGTCSAEALLTAPLSGESCVAYQIGVSVERTSTDGPERWEVATVSELTPFEIAWGGRSARVAGEPSCVSLRWPSATKQQATLNRLPQHLHGRIIALARERYGEDRQDVIPRSGEEVFLRERVLRPESTVLVVGRLARVSGADGGAQEFQIEPRSGLPLLVSEGTRDDLVDDLRVGRRELPDRFLR